MWKIPSMGVLHGCTANFAGTINTPKAVAHPPIPSGESMPLLRPSPSKQIWKAYQDGLTEMIELDRSPTGLPEGLPQPLYVLHSADIAAGEGLSGAQHTAWRFYRGSSAGP